MHAYTDTTLCANTCMQVRIDTYTSTHLHMCTPYSHTRACKHSQTYTPMHIHICHKDTCICAYANVIETQSYAYTIYECIYTKTHAYIVCTFIYLCVCVINAIFYFGKIWVSPMCTLGCTLCLYIMMVAIVFLCVCLRTCMRI